MARTSPERSAAVEKLIERIELMHSAPTEPTPQCKDGGEHSFKSIGHADGRDSYTWLYQCEKCGEHVKKEAKRTGRDKKYWE